MKFEGNPQSNWCDPNHRSSVQNTESNLKITAAQDYFDAIRKNQRTSQAKIVERGSR